MEFIGYKRRGMGKTEIRKGLRMSNYGFEELEVIKKNWESSERSFRTLYNSMMHKVLVANKLDGDVVQLATATRGIIEVNMGWSGGRYTFTKYTKKGELAKKCVTISSFHNLLEEYKPLSEMTREDWERCKK